MQRQHQPLHRPSNQQTQQQRLLRALEAHLLADDAPLPPLFYGGPSYTPFACPICDTLWSIDPTGRNVGRVTPMRLHLEQVAPALCRTCSREHRGGALEVDQYEDGLGGFGYNWEGDDPVGGHILLTCFDSAWMNWAQHLERRDSLEFVSQSHRARHVLSWIAEQQIWPEGYELTSEETHLISLGNPPGHGVPNLWWKGMGFAFSEDSPLLSGKRESFILIAIAVPRQEPLQRDALLRIGQLLARLSTTIQLPGDPFDVGYVRRTFSPLEWMLHRKGSNVVLP